MSEAPATPATDAAPAADAPATSLTAAPAAAEGAAEPGAEGQGQDAPSVGQGDDAAASGQGADEGDAATGGDDQGEAGAEGGGDSQSAAVEYTAFTMPEHFELEGETLDGIVAFAKANNFTQEQAQALVDLGVAQSKAVITEFAQEAAAHPVPMNAHWAKVWSGETAQDAEIGGEKLNSTMALASRVCATFASPKLVEFLNSTGLAHHPELVRFMRAVGDAVSEDTLVTPQDGARHNGAVVDRDLARASKLYPNMATN